MTDVEQGYEELSEITERKEQTINNINAEENDDDSKEYNKCCKHILFGLIMMCCLIMVMIAGVDEEYIVGSVDGYDITKHNDLYDGSIIVKYKFEHQTNHRSIVMLENYTNKTMLYTDLETRFPLKTDYAINKYAANGYIITLFIIIELVALALCNNVKIKFN